MAQAGETFEIISGSDSLDLSDAVNLRVIEFEGLGMAPVQRFELAGPAQNGSSDAGFRLLPRTMRIAVRATADNITDFHTRRERLMEMCRPSTSPIQLRWTQANGNKRQIDCYYTGGLDLASTQSNKLGGWVVGRNWDFRDVIVLRAPDPTFYDPDGFSEDFSLSYSPNAFLVPTVVPSFVGTTSLNITTTFDNTARNAWDTYPTIVILGPVTGLKITNNTTGDLLDFGSNTIGSSTTYTIDTRYGYKSVTDQLGASQVSKLSTTSDLATWRLVPGVNSITVVGTALDGNTRIYIQGNRRFIGP